jgi:hypothetical protein
MMLFQDGRKIITPKTNDQRQNASKQQLGQLLVLPIDLP